MNNHNNNPDPNFTILIKQLIHNIIVSYISLYIIWISWTLYFYSQIIYLFHISIYLSLIFLLSHLYSSYLKLKEYRTINSQQQDQQDNNEPNFPNANDLNITTIRTQIIEKLIIMIALILIYVSILFDMYSFIPYLPFFGIFSIFLRIRLYYIKQEHQECVTFYNFFLGFIQFAIGATISTVYLKMGSQFNFTCKSAYWPLWILFAINIGVNFAFLLVLINRAFLKLMTGSVEGDEIIGLVWILMISSGFTISLFFFSEGMIQLCNNEELTQLMLALIVICSKLALFTIFSFLLKQKLVNFLLILTQNDNSDDEEEEVNTQQAQTSQERSSAQKKLKVLSNNKNKTKQILPYFLIRLNGTYFKKNVELDNDRIKSRIMKIKNKNSNKEQQNQFKKQILFQQQINNDFLALESFPTNSRQGTNQRIETGVGHIDTNPVNDMVLPTLGPIDQFQDNDNKQKQIDLKAKMNKILEMEKVKVEENEKKENEQKLDEKEISQSRGSIQQHDVSIQNCLICYEKLADSVFLECGHGGICFDCGLAIKEKSGECFLCRSNIVQIIQLDLNFTDKKYYKVIQGSS